MTDFQSFLIPPAGDYNSVFNYYNYSGVSGFYPAGVSNVANAYLPRKPLVIPQTEENTVPKHQYLD